MQPVITGAGESPHCTDPSVAHFHSEEHLFQFQGESPGNLAVGQEESSLAHGRVSPFDLFSSSSAGLTLTHVREHLPHPV